MIVTLFLKIFLSGFILWTFTIKNILKYDLLKRQLKQLFSEEYFFRKHWRNIYAKPARL